MWDPTVNAPCPCSRTKDIPVVRIKVPELEEDLDKLNAVGSEYSPAGAAGPEDGGASLAPSGRSAAFVPSPYLFRLSCGPPHPGQHAHAPPLWLLVDHTLAVLYSLFSQDNHRHQPLGVGQLEWALAFLRSLRGSSSERYHPDVQLSMDAIENRLFTLFAEAKESLEDKAQPCSLHTCDPCFHRDRDRDRDRQKQGAALEPIKEEEPEAGGGVASAASGTQGGLELATQTQLVCPNVEVAEKHVPVSVTIHSMLRSHSPSVHQLFLRSGGAAVDRPSDDALPLPLPLADSRSTIPSKDEVLELLKKWRQDQIDRIEGEKQRLRSIEAALANVDTPTSTSKKDLGK